MTELDARFSSPGAQPRPWPEVVAALERAEMFWLSTVRRDGRPHVTPLPAMWLDGALHFCTGPGEQKAMNLKADPRCVLTTGTDPPAPTATVRASTWWWRPPVKVLAFGKGEPFSQTRYRFPGAAVASPDGRS